MSEAQCRYSIEEFMNELGTDYESLSGLYSSYFSEMDEEIDSMRELLRRNDWYMLGRVVHNVKGVSVNLHIDDVFNEAAVLDRQLKEDSVENAGILVEKIIELIKNAEIEIRRFFLEKGFTVYFYYIYIFRRWASVLCKTKKE